ncbi:hypothetical protein BZA77DRAFT_317764 [Pyronema omphalodes]|nr:hypothetical protein BZA77DRAFT_317764 [Pyronema omphalodes]
MIKQLFFFATAVVGAFASAVEGSAYNRFTLTVDTPISGLIWNQLMFFNGSAYIGNIKYNRESEPLPLASYDLRYGMFFTSFHSTQRGTQRLFLYETQAQPISFTNPFSVFMPEGGVGTGFETQGGYLQFNGKENWKACMVPTDQLQPYYTPSWKIVWDGPGTAKGCEKVRLKIGKVSC